ncbi:MAG: DUF502 domain-containing protein [Gemmatimonadota bacterium]
MASGLVVLIPLVVTVAVIRFLFGFTSGILLPIIDPAVGDWPPMWRALLSLGVLLAAIYILGEIAHHVVGRRVLGVGEAIVMRVPFVKVIYSASKQVVAAFQGRGTRAFQSVVFVEHPRPGMRAIGFVTSTTRREDGQLWSTVFIPTTPNPTTGFLQLVRDEELIRTSYSVEDGIKMVMSLGVLLPRTGETGPRPTP